MTGLVILIPIALLLGLMGLLAFFWALRSGQFEDLDGAAVRILLDEEDEALPGPDYPDDTQTDKMNHSANLRKDSAMEARSEDTPE